MNTFRFITRKIAAIHDSLVALSFVGMRSSPFHFFVETVPDYPHVLSQWSYGYPDPSMRVRSTLNMALHTGFRLRIRVMQSRTYLSPSGLLYL